MGCCGSGGSYQLFDKLETKMVADTEVATFDEVMKECEEILTKIEEIRVVIAEPWGKLLCQSGAVVLKKPGVLSCILGLFFQTTRDIGPDVDKIITVKMESPYLDVDTSKGDTANVISTKECFINFANTVKELKPQGEDLKAKLEVLFNKVSDSVGTWMEQFKEKAGGLMEMRPLIGKLNDNRKKLQAGMGIMGELIGLLGSFALDTATLINKMKDQKEMEKFYLLFKKINTETKKDNEGKNKSNRVLFWNYTEEEKHGKFEDIKPIWFKINNEDYTEKGPVKVEVKETKKDEKKKEEGKKEEGKKDDGKKDDGKKDDGKKEVAKVEVKDDAKYNVLQGQIDELKKLIADLKGGNNSSQVTQKSIYINKPTPLKNWNLSLIKSFEIQGIAKSICMNYETDTFIVGTKKGNILTYKLASFDLVDNFNNVHNGTVKDIVYLSDGRTIVSVGNDGKLVRIDLETKLTKEFATVLPKPIKSVAYALDGTTIWVACDRSLHAFDVNTLQQLNDKTANFDSDLLKIVWIKETRQIALGFRNGNVKIWDPTTKRAASEFSDHKNRVTDLAWTKFNGSVAIASSSKDKTFNIYGVEENKLLKSLKTPLSRTTTHSNTIFYGYDDKTLFTTHEDGKIIMNNFTTGDLEKEQSSKPMSSSADKISSAFYCGDGINFIVGMQSGKIEIYATK